MRDRPSLRPSICLIGLCLLGCGPATGEGEGTSTSATEEPDATVSTTSDGPSTGTGPTGMTEASTGGATTESGDTTTSGTTEEATGTETETEGTTGTTGTTGGEELSPLADMSLGPYPSALTILLDSIVSNSASLDTGANYDHSAGQGYVLQATAGLLAAAWGHELPGGEDTRDLLVDLALTEIEELIPEAGKVVGGGPAFGLSDAWDAFGDGTTNPAYTAYTWQSGMVALGIAELLAYVDMSDGRHDAEAERIAAARGFLGEMLLLWNGHYTEIEEGGETLGYFWYSTEPADAKAVHNTSALVAMASQLHYEATEDPAFADRPEACARLLRKRATTTAKGGYSWNYVDDGWPVDKRVAEDVSHALVTLQLIRFAGERGWWTGDDMAKISRTLGAQIWSGHPARLHGRVDGSSGGDNDWKWTRAAAIGYAVHGDAPGADPVAFDLARSILVSSYLTPYERPLMGGTVDSARTLVLGRLFEHRPQTHLPDSSWSIVAGPGDDALPEMPGGVRFYTVDWAAPAEIGVGGLSLPARRAMTESANMLVDLEEDDTRQVVVSLSYSAATDGIVQEWDGASYHTLATLPATKDASGVVRWMRTSFRLDPKIRYDYQPGQVGTNVLLQVTSEIDLHRIEATPF